MTDIKRSFKVSTPVHDNKRVYAISPLDACQKVASSVYKRIKQPFLVTLIENTKGKKPKTYQYNVLAKKTGKLVFSVVKKGGNLEPVVQVKNNVHVDLYNIGDEVKLDIKFNNEIDKLLQEAKEKLKAQIEGTARNIKGVLGFLRNQQEINKQIEPLLKERDFDEARTKHTVSHTTLKQYKALLLDLQGLINLKDIVVNGKESTNIPTNQNAQGWKYNNCKFVIITYWWGRGNNNRNLQYPCPEDAGRPDEEINSYYGDGYAKMMKSRGKPPVKFDLMIKDWQKSCEEQGCYHYSMEYPEFSNYNGMYQLAINAKPLFIKHALQRCKELFQNAGKEFTGVVYIDGDMTVNKFPHIFNMNNIDMMARGWNIDPRSSARQFRRGLYSFDPYVFETSGGIMFFGDTGPARTILNLWHSISSNRLFQGKADDRILSVIINKYAMQVPYNIVQLPIEYLWLTDIYGEKRAPLEPIGALIKPGDVVGRDGQADISGDIIFEHPGCLTGEERAADQGAANDRSPPLYDTYVTTKINDAEHGGIFYNKVMFETVPLAQDSYRVYLQQLSSLDNDDTPPPYYVENDYGDLETVVKNNMKQLANTKEVFEIKQRKGEPVIVNPSNNGQDVPNVLSLLMQGHDVIYCPDKNTKRMEPYVDMLKVYSKSNLEFICFRSQPLSHGKAEYKMIYDSDKPIYFSCQNNALRHLLLMSNTIFETSTVNVQKPAPKTISTKLSDIFNSSHVFLSLIRCMWINPNTSQLINSTKRIGDADVLKTFFSNLPHFYKSETYGGKSLRKRLT